MKLSALSVEVSELGRTALGTQILEKYSDISVETVTTGFRDHIQCLPQTPPFFGFALAGSK